ncbi:histidine phosphatase family protein [Candidatus Woesearchaeota archaeon]|nr:histidine phosphatase family protein [Candidatus Woesearchaeota archaeon]
MIEISDRPNGKRVDFYRCYASTQSRSLEQFLGRKGNPPLAHNSAISVNVYYDRLYASPAKRAIQTSRTLSRKRIHKRDELLEFDFGHVDRLDYALLCRKYPEKIEAWDEGRDVAFPGGERFSQLYKRQDDFFQMLLEDDFKQAAVVTHHMWLKGLLSRAYVSDKLDMIQEVLPRGKVLTAYVSFGKVLMPSTLSSIPYLEQTSPLSPDPQASYR